MRFLAEASKLLAELSDVPSTLQKVARLAVPHFADWCAVDLLAPDGSLQRQAVAHADPAKVALAHELHRRYAPEVFTWRHTEAERFPFEPVHRANVLYGATAVSPSFFARFQAAEFSLVHAHFGPVGAMGQRILQPVVKQQVDQVLSALDKQVSAAAASPHDDATSAAAATGE